MACRYLDPLPISASLHYNLLRSTLSYAFSKPMKHTYKGRPVFRAMSINRRKTSICSSHPRPFCAPACSTLGGIIDGIVRIHRVKQLLEIPAKHFVTWSGEAVGDVSNSPFQLRDCHSWRLSLLAKMFCQRWWELLFITLWTAWDTRVRAAITPSWRAWDHERQQHDLLSTVRPWCIYIEEGRQRSWALGKKKNWFKNRILHK